MEPVKIGLLGLGTVGGGTVTVLTRNAREIERRAGRGIEIARAAAREYRAESITGIERIGQIGDDAFAVVEDPEIQVIVELIGGYSPAKELVLRAIALGKHVVTANKALIARHGNEIFAAARDQGVMVGFEAAVARDYPVIFGTLFFFGLIGLVVGILSDLMYVFVDPRIDFERREV
jgi:homoserine dehydrogenase